jgi:ureidoacrylate peracid hydrolase
MVELQPETRCYGHMLILVSDIEQSVRFYTEQLGFKIRPAKPLADGRHFVAFHQGIAFVAGRKNDDRQIDHVAFEVNDIRKMDAKLQKANIKYFQGLHNGPYGLTIYIADPDGTKVELYQVGQSI